MDTFVDGLELSEIRLLQGLAEGLRGHRDDMRALLPLVEQCPDASALASSVRSVLAAFDTMLAQIEALPGPDLLAQVERVRDDMIARVSRTMRVTGPVYMHVGRAPTGEAMLSGSLSGLKG